MICSSNEQCTVLVVDDTPENLLVLGEILQPELRVRVANNGLRALAVAQTPPYPDLILLDVMMPQLDGYGVLARLREDPRTRDIPVIFVTALDGADDEERGLELGAVDYIAKPLRASIVRTRVRTQLALKRARDALAVRDGALEAEVARRVRAQGIADAETICLLAGLAESRDREPGHHIRRTQAYLDLLAQGLRDHPRWSTALAPQAAATLVRAAPLHDLGKVSIPDRLLRKEGRLTPEEFALVQTHCRVGSDAIDAAMRALGAGLSAPDPAPACPVSGAPRVSPHALSEGLPDAGQSAPAADADPMALLRIARQIARSHHERWDGSGYPDGLAGAAIPPPARLMAVADAFDALVCRLVYATGAPYEAALDGIAAGRGSRLDPDAVDAFLADREALCAVAARYPEDPATVRACVGAFRDQGPE